MEQQLLNFLSPQDEIRNNAMSQIEKLCSERPNDLASSLCQYLTSGNQNEPTMQVQLRQVSSLVLHKQLLSKKQNFERIQPGTLGQISQSILACVEGGAEKMNWGLLKRCAEILIEISVKCQKNEEFFNQIANFHGATLTQFANSPSFVQRAKFGLYCFELFCEFAEEVDFVQNHTPQFLSIFDKSFSCGNPEVKNFCTGPLCMFLVQCKQGEIDASAHGILETLVEVLISNIKGKQNFIFL